MNIYNTSWNKSRSYAIKQITTLNKELPLRRDLKYVTGNDFAKCQRHHSL